MQLVNSIRLGIVCLFPRDITLCGSHQLFVVVKRHSVAVYVCQQTRVARRVTWSPGFHLVEVSRKRSLFFLTLPVSEIKIACDGFDQGILVHHAKGRVTSNLEGVCCVRLRKNLA
jgi:hypothetical protein